MLDRAGGIHVDLIFIERKVEELNIAGVYCRWFLSVGRDWRSLRRRGRPGETKIIASQCSFFCFHPFLRMLRRPTKVWKQKNKAIALFRCCGEGEIRTRGGFTLGSLANCWFKPLTHLSKKTRYNLSVKNLAFSITAACIFVVGQMGLEPMTPSLKGMYSTNWVTDRICRENRIRTCSLLSHCRWFAVKFFYKNRVALSIFYR